MGKLDFPKQSAAHFLRTNPWSDPVFSKLELHQSRKHQFARAGTKLKLHHSDQIHRDGRLSLTKSFETARRSRITRLCWISLPAHIQLLSPLLEWE